MALRPVVELAISLPFKIDSLGVVAATADQDKIWADKVRSVIGTALGQRVFRPSFGCNATLGTFESEEFVRFTVEEDVRVAFQTYLQLVTLDAVYVSVDPTTLVVTVEISYVTPSGNGFISRLGIATLNGTAPISEEFVWQNQ